MDGKRESRGNMFGGLDAFDKGIQGSGDGHPRLRGSMKIISALALFLLVAFQAAAGTLAPFSYTASSYAPGATATYTFSYTTETLVPPSYNIILYAQFPSGFNNTAGGPPIDPGKVTVTVNGTPANVVAGWGLNVNLIVCIDTAVPGGSNVVVAIQDVVNHPTPGTYYFNFVKTADASGVAIDSAASIDPITIAAVELTVDGSFSANNKNYDSTTDATIATDSLNLVGVEPGDDVTLNPVLAFADATVDAGKTVTLTVASSLSGNNAGKYVLSLAGAPTTTADITAKPLALDGLTADSKPYDGTTAATISNYGFLTGVVGTEDVSIDTTSADASFDTVAVGTGKTVTVTGLALVGADVDNYSIDDQATTADITQEPLTLAANPAEGGTTNPTPGESSYTAGAPVPITAIAAEGYTFVNWTVNAGDATLGTADSITTTVTVNDDAGATVVANFAINQYVVTFQTDGTEGATVNGTTIVTDTVDHGGSTIDVTAVAPAELEFTGWSGDSESNAETISVTNVTGNMTIIANFGRKMAVGSTFTIGAEQVFAPVEDFAVKPRIHTQFNNPVNGKVQKAAAKVLTKVSAKAPQADITNEWTKKIRLYDLKAFKAAEKTGDSAEAWLAVDGNQAPLDLDLLVTTKQQDIVNQPLLKSQLQPPAITDISEAGGPLIITGRWFGTKAPKVWREYTVPGKTEGSFVIKRQTLKVIKPTIDNTTFVDSKGKPACMNATDGDSMILATPPAADPKGNRNGTIVLDNGVGLATGTDPTIR